MMQGHYAIDWSNWTIYVNTDMAFKVDDLGTIFNSALRAEREHNKMQRASWKIRPMAEMNGELETYEYGEVNKISSNE